jgi:hypothetical protein
MRNTLASAALLSVGLLASPVLAGCTSTAAENAVVAPASVEEVSGSDVKKVTLTQDAAAAIGVKTAPVTPASGGRLAVPYAAVIYYLDGSAWTYTAEPGRRYLRVPITIAAIEGDRATLTRGPAAGTPVVVVGAPELLGAELEIAGEQ